VLAVSTACAPDGLPLPEAVESFKDLAVAAVALHRPASPAEADALRPLSRRVHFVAVFGDVPGADVGAPILVVEGGPAEEERDTSLDALCRRLHALGRVRIALRTPANRLDHPAPEEIELVHDSLRNVGYWHDATRGGTEYLALAERYLLGASFDPLEDFDLAGLADALPARAPAVIVCAPERVREAVRRARGFFRA